MSAEEKNLQEELRQVQEQLKLVQKRLDLYKTNFEACNEYQKKCQALNKQWADHYAKHKIAPPKPPTTATAQVVKGVQVQPVISPNVSASVNVNLANVDTKHSTGAQNQCVEWISNLIKKYKGFTLLLYDTESATKPVASLGLISDLLYDTQYKNQEYIDLRYSEYVVHAKDGSPIRTDIRDGPYVKQMCAKFNPQNSSLIRELVYAAVIDSSEFESTDTRPDRIYNYWSYEYDQNIYQASYRAHQDTGKAEVTLFGNLQSSIFSDPNRRIADPKVVLQVIVTYRMGDEKLQSNYIHKFHHDVDIPDNYRTRFDLKESSLI
jgi:hypothetical protein